MKKTLVALAVAAIATSASAATVYNNDGTQVDVGGRFDVALGKFNKNERADLRNVGSRLEFKAQHDLGEGVKVIGYSRLRFNDGGDKWDTGSSFNNIKTDKLWLALQKDEIGRVSFGKQNTSGDDVELNDFSYLFGGNNDLLTSGSKVVSFRSADYQLAEGHTLGFGADYVFGEAKKKSNNTELKYGYVASLFYAGQLADDLGLNVNAGYTVENTDNGSDKSAASGTKKTAWRVASQLVYGPVAFGVEYAESHHKDKTADKKQGVGRFIEVGAKYQYLDNASVYAAWDRNQYKGKAAGLTDVGNFLTAAAGYTVNVPKGKALTENVYLVGTDYAFNKNVVAYVEYAHSRVRGTGQVKGVDPNSEGQTKLNDNRYGVGLRVYF